MFRMDSGLERTWRGCRVLAALVGTFAAISGCGAATDSSGTRDSGEGGRLEIIDHVVGQGEEAEPGRTVEVHYTGWIYVDGERGSRFDSSVGKSPFRFPLGGGRVIRGWDEGVAGMKVGGRRELIIPPEMGYGTEGFPPVIPPDSTLNFEVELVRVLP